MAATVRKRSLTSGLGKGQVELSESDVAQEAQDKVCRGRETTIAGTSVPMTIWPGGLTWTCIQAIHPQLGGLELWQTRATQPGQE